ncbi:CLUMA_CG001046, isoform A [Clunio marinus]|uniref:CLUMA_CG001046, isoform A n=1 Tax=Clunio marinus TaxID=568069 RepID=A0A1J1HIM2_9DIPT|nr:CLUMA_CG001046, isoform A [Clunio marinus]
MTHAACHNRRKGDSASDILGDIKCGITTVKETIKDGVKEGVKEVKTKIVDHSVKTFDAIAKAVTKTKETIDDGLDVAVQAGKNSFKLVHEIITGRKVWKHHDKPEIVDIHLASEEAEFEKDELHDWHDKLHEYHEKDETHEKDESHEKHDPIENEIFYIGEPKEEPKVDLNE